MDDPNPNDLISLPAPKRQRWQPLRGGLLNLYRYDRQEFHYEDGRLLLRGNNGSGKSRVLALQLPFLLDGEIIPQRVEPDGDSAKRMEWNLLLGGKHDDRLGYTWIEFGRITEHGEAEFKTLGCALRAVQGRGVAQQWLFISRQRVGRDLFLEGDLRQPLSKAKLEAAVGDQGQVFGSGKLEEDRREYRHAVDQALFGLGNRYEALLSLLIQLRQPQLSRTLNEERLSDALSQALPPLPESVLGDVAEAFRTLEADRNELSDFIAARDSAEAFLKDYRRYVQIAARRRAEAVRQTHSAYETTMRRLRAAESEHEAAGRELETIRNRAAELALNEQSALAAERALRDSPEMRDAKALEDARIAARDAKIDAEKSRAELDQAEKAVDRARRSEAAAREKAARERERVDQAASHSLERARAVGLDARHSSALERLQLEEADAAGIDPVAATLHDALTRRLEGARHIRKLDERVSSVRQEAAIAQQAFAAAESQMNEGVEAERDAATALDNESASVIDAYRNWAQKTAEARPPDADAVEAAFENWLEAPEGDSPVAKAVHRAESEASRRIASQRAETEARLREARDREQELSEELRRLRTGYHQPPPPPHTRDPAARATRLGAPLWALCDFHSAVSETDRPNLEAALEASGLLDAWITPDGRALDAESHDTLLAADASARAPEGRSLANVLFPAIDDQNPQARAVSSATVSAVLERIGFGERAGEVWVDALGRWQVGPLHGAWSKSAAEHIGLASREAARRRRLAELEEELAAVARAVASIEGELDALDQRINALRREIDDAPSDGDVRRALAQLDAARRAVSRLRLRLTEAEGRLTEKRRKLTDATNERDQAAADLRLSEWIDRIDALIEALHDYNQSLAELWPAARAHAEARIQFEAAVERVEEAQRDRALRESRAAELHGKSEAAASRHQTMENALSATVRDIQQRLQETVERVDRIRKEKEETEKQNREQQVAQAVAQEKIAATNNELTAKDSERSTAIDSLAAFVQTRQLPVAHAELASMAPDSWSVARAVDLARNIEAKLSDVGHDDAAWNRHQREIHSHFEVLQTSLRAHGHGPEASMSDGIFVVSVQFQGRSCTIADLRDQVVTIIQERQELLDAREREVLENYLIDEVAEHLHDLLHNALKWVQEANEELRVRPMDTGMTLRFAWTPVAEGLPAFVEARRLLLSARNVWSPQERAAVGAFLQEQIKAVRSANETGAWQDHLAEAFDYRKWHQFGVERKQDGVWKRLTRRTHGTGSGGEKAIALTLPQLAAAAAHYRTAGSSAPRLILLDEAFVGVDKNMRAKCMDLLVAFDLDVVMTSESEWGCYPSVPAIAIYQLSVRDGVDAVHATRWVWNGKQRVRDDSPAPPARRPTTVSSEESAANRETAPA